MRDGAIAGSLYILGQIDSPCLHQSNDHTDFQLTNDRLFYREKMAIRRCCSFH